MDRKDGLMTMILGKELFLMMFAYKGDLFFDGDDSGILGKYLSVLLQEPKPTTFQ